MAQDVSDARVRRAVSFGALTLSISSPSCGNISHIINVVFVFHMIYLMSLLSSHSFPPPFPTISFTKLHSSNRHYSDDLQSNVVVLHYAFHATSLHHSNISTPIPIYTHFNDLQYIEEFSRRRSHAITSPHTLLPPLILFSASHIHLILISCPLISSRFNFKYISFAVHPPYFSISKPHNLPSSCSLTFS